MPKIGRNEKCPCGSGKKYKQCCLVKQQQQQTSVRYTSEDRAEGLTALDAFCARRLAAERERVGLEVWGEDAARTGELSDHVLQASEALIDAWFWFDRPLDEGDEVLPIDLLLRHGPSVGPGARAWLEQMRTSSMRLYEVVDVLPGTSIHLRDLLARSEVTVSERTLSRQVNRSDTLAARVVRTGASGRPELDLSVVLVPMMIRDPLCAALEEDLDAFRRDLPGEPEEMFWKEEAPPMLHAFWIGAVLDPVVPRMTNTDGDDIVLTEVTFAVEDGERLARALVGVPGIEAEDGGTWTWVTSDGRADPVSLGMLRLQEGKLHLECNSVARGERGRALIEAAAGDAARFVAASHEDPTEMLRERLRRGDTADLEDPGPAPAIPPEVHEELVLTFLARHYRDWVDHPLPALGGATPREAAGRPQLVTELVSLVRGIEGMYQGALRDGQPAYDPSWMWEELGLPEVLPPAPHVAAHDRLDAAHPGLGVLTRQVA
nr:SEC-C domain-containing protein [Deltaproteobacteria bacterium]